MRCKGAVCPEGQGGEEYGRGFVEGIGGVATDVPKEDASVNGGKTGFVLVLESPATYVLA